MEKENANRFDFELGMFPSKSEDFFIAEPLGDLLFLIPKPCVYYLEEVGKKILGQGLVAPEKLVIRKLENPDFLHTMDAYFHGGKYNISFNLVKGGLDARLFRSTWSFRKDDIIKYVKSTYILDSLPLEDGTGEQGE